MIPSTTIVCLLSGRWDILDRTLEWLKQTDPSEFRILMVNGSSTHTDHRVHQLKASRQNVCVVDLPLLESYDESLNGSDWISSSVVREDYEIQGSPLRAGSATDAEILKNDDVRRVNAMVGSLYQTSLRFVETQYMMTLEDDCIPTRGPRKVFAYMSKMLVDGCVSVGACYAHRQRPYCWCAWEWDQNFETYKMARRKDNLPARPGHGLGLSLMIYDEIKKIGFETDGRHLDVELSRSIWKSGKRQEIAGILVDHLI